MKTERTSYMRTGRTSLGADMGYLILKILAIAGILVLTFTFALGIFRNPDISMAPAVKDGDLVFFNRLDKSCVSSDVVVVKKQGEKQVRRVVAIAGDTVDITEDGLMVNDAYVQEPGIYEQTGRYAEGIEFPVTLEEGEIFVLGDKRENSTDSRIYGPVKTEDILGKVITLIRRRGI